VLIAALTHRGMTRTENQDAGGAGRWLLADGLLGTMYLPVRKVVPCCVADGAGGHPAGRRASSIAASAFLDTSAHQSERADVAAAALAAHRALQREMEGDPGCSGMGSTIAALQVTKSDVFLANVGDSRIYELNPSGITQLSVDDHPPKPDFVSDAATTSVLTQMLGGPAGGAEPIAHIERCPVEHGLRFLLCSDGLAAVLQDHEIAAIVAHASTDTQAVEDLVAGALDRGAPDNVTVMLAEIRQR
jgi:serine/threonine protein phosphatase PrpC